MEPNYSLIIILFAGILLAISMFNVLQHLAKWGFRKDTELFTALWLYLIASEVTLFWEILSLLSKTEWSLGELFLVLLGPVLISTAALKLTASSKRTCSPEHFLKKSRGYYSIIALLQLWILLADFSFHCFTVVRIGTIITMGVATALIFTKSYRWHISGSVALWLTLLYNTILI